MCYRHDFTEKLPEPFDQGYMRALFDYGYQRAIVAAIGQNSRPFSR